MNSLLSFGPDLNLADDDDDAFVSSRQSSIFNDLLTYIKKIIRVRTCSLDAYLTASQRFIIRR